jgi:hypothetical protein
LSANRFEEVNNYSGRMTRRKANMTAWRISRLPDRIDADPGVRLVDGATGIPAGFGRPNRSAEQRKNVEFYLPKSLSGSVNSSFAKHRHFLALARAISPECMAAVVQ